MKIICTRKNLPRWWRSAHRVDDGECSICLLYGSCGGEKKVVQFCTVNEGGSKYRNEVMRKRCERAQLVLDDEG